MCVGSLGHLDNCKSCGVFNIFKSMFKNACIWLTSSITQVCIKWWTYTMTNASNELEFIE